MTLPGDIHYTATTRLRSPREIHLKTAILLRIASVLTFIFFVGHTYAALGTPPRNPGEAAVFMAMQSYQLKLLGAIRTHWDFYRGLSILFGVTLLLLTVLLWQLSITAKTDPLATRPLVASLLVGYLAFTIVGGLYFFFVPAASSAAVAICLALAFTSAKKG
jgi:RsiW-degrading membrane proteinase PrsW (M82 family)